MIQLLVRFAFIVLIVVASGCSQNPSGVYVHEKNPSRQLTLTKDKQFLLSTGDSGSYSIDGGAIVMTTSIFGGARGEIKGGAIIFPNAPEDNLVGATFSGKWIKK